MMNVFLLFLIVVSISLLFTQTVFAQTTDEEKKKFNLYRDKGIEFSDIGKYERSIRYFKAALEIKPSDSTTLGELGFVYFIEGDFKRAVEYFEQAQRLSPENENILEILKEATKLDLGDISSPAGSGGIQDTINAGNQLYDDEKYSEALVYFEEALDSNPVDTKALTASGHILVQLGRYDEAIPYYDRATKSLVDCALCTFSNLSEVKSYLKGNKNLAILLLEQSGESSTDKNTDDFFGFTVGTTESDIQDSIFGEIVIAEFVYWMIAIAVIIPIGLFLYKRKTRHHVMD